MGENKFNGRRVLILGGMGFIENNKASCMLSVLINTHLLQASVEAGVKRFFYASSACVYNAEKQVSQDVIPLKEEDAYPAMPEDGYGWEKLFSERMCRHFTEDFGLKTRVARLLGCGRTSDQHQRKKNDRHPHSTTSQPRIRSFCCID